ncbi:MAG: glycosyltransferase family protein [Stellaceae bacterium]
MAGSVLFHVQHLLGIGHLQRTLRIADAFAKSGIAATLVSGGLPVEGLAASRTYQIVQLPPIRARDASFALLDGNDRPVGEKLWQARREALLAAFAAARPDVVVLEGFPFARRAFRGELDPLIATVRARGGRLVSSIRDILVRRDDPARHRAIAERVRADFDLVLVHGDPAFVSLEASFPAAEIADRLRYTGYVAAPKAETADAEETDGARTEVIVSAGGGAAGRALLQAALLARRAGVLADGPWRLLAGPNLPEPEFRAFGVGLPPNVIVERFRPDLPRLLRRARVSISQAGYNTVLDVLAARAPAVFVPFAEGRETEQSVRAAHLAARGAGEMVPGAKLSPERLAAAIRRALARGPGTLVLDTGGARRSAELIAGLIRGPNRPAGPSA